jgi:hypothetical protein
LEKISISGKEIAVFFGKKVLNLFFGKIFLMLFLEKKMFPIFSQGKNLISLKKFGVFFGKKFSILGGKNIFEVFQEKNFNKVSILEKIILKFFQKKVSNLFLTNNVPLLLQEIYFSKFLHNNIIEICSQKTNYYIFL